MSFTIDIYCIGKDKTWYYSTERYPKFLKMYY